MSKQLEEVDKQLKETRTALKQAMQDVQEPTPGKTADGEAHDHKKVGTARGIETMHGRISTPGVQAPSQGHRRYEPENLWEC